MIDPAFAIALFDRWTAMWDGWTELAHGIMADRFVLRYAQPGTEPMDAVTTPEALSDLIRRWREMRVEPHFRAEGQPLVEIGGADAPGSGTVVRPYSTTFGPGEARRTVSGIDWLRFEAGRIVEVLSASGGAEGRSFGLD